MRTSAHWPDTQGTDPPGGADDMRNEAFVFKLHEESGLEDIRKHGQLLTPGRYVGSQPAKLDAAIAVSLEALAYAA